MTEWKPTPEWEATVQAELDAMNARLARGRRRKLAFGVFVALVVLVWIVAGALTGH